MLQTELGFISRKLKILTSKAFYNSKAIQYPNKQFNMQSEIINKELNYATIFLHITPDPSEK